jgi:hypothetical protein
VRTADKKKNQAEKLRYRIHHEQRVGSENLSGKAAEQRAYRKADAERRCDLALSAALLSRLGFIEGDLSYREGKHRFGHAQNRKSSKKNSRGVEKKDAQAANDPSEQRSSDNQRAGAEIRGQHSR